MDQVDALFLEFQGAVVGRYALERELGRGGMGVVYLAHELRLDRLVAIKVLPPEMAAQPSLRERFLREARTAARLSHPHIVPIYSVDEVGGFVFYAMAFVDGETLGQRLNSRGSLGSTEASRILREVSWALAHAHAQGVVHRDVKPANILLEKSSGRALVADFGIARLAKLDGGTTDGERLGTPEYMSPEQAAGDAIDGRSDIYSLGIVGFVALTGQLPFKADSAQTMLAQHITKQAPTVTSVMPSTRRALAESIDRCLQKDPAARFPDASALADALGESIEKRVEIPIPVRLYLDRRRTLGPLILGGALSLPAISVLLPMWNDAVDLGITSAPIIGSAFIALLVTIAGFGLRLRRLAESGHGPDDLVAALREGFRKRREEFEFEFGSRPGRFEVALWTFAALCAIGTAVMASLIVAYGGTWKDLLEATALPLGFGVFSTVGSLMLRSARKATRSVWESFWRTRFARSLARIAAAGVAPRNVVADRPTEVAIALSAQALYDELPKESRRQLGDFPEVMKALEDRAVALRARIADLDAAAIESARIAKLATPQQRAIMMGDLEKMRSEAQDRLRGIVTGLGTLRLDLLRLKVGSMSLDGFTADLSAARELGDEAQRLLDAKREVERAIGPVSPRPA
jgi:predicted Ser/Thr protein kinase